MSPTHRYRRLALVAALCALSLTACEAEIYHNLDERRANAMIVALEQQGIQADKAVDPASEGMWLVKVPSGRKVEAWHVLETQGLPRPESEGFGKFYPSSGLIPTSNEEQVLLQYATAQELRRGLLTVDGVVDAHVNLVLPKKSRVRLSSEAPERPRASVLVKYRQGEGAPVPVTEAQVKLLMAGGVQDMGADDVAVILVPDARPPLKAPTLQQVGPIAVSPSSKLKLQLIISVLCLGLLALGAVIGVLLRRGRDAQVVS